MDNNANDSGSRVTRSLRKRLTSVDSDNSSRPGTPVPSKLIAISEISASPSRSTRMTRRNSTTGVATPVKTPAKRGAASSTTIVENMETVTPARRSTRRRSVSTYEIEETQTSLKVPAFTALDEEVDSRDQITTRVTRSQSKSPQQIKSKASPSPKQAKSLAENKNKELEVENAKTVSNQKRRKPGPKCKTREHDELQVDSDVEISVLGNEMEEIKNKSSNITTIVLTDDESNQTSNTNKEEKDKTYQENISALKEINSENSDKINDADNLELNKTELQIADINMDVDEVQDNIESTLGKIDSVPSDATMNADEKVNEMIVEKYTNKFSEQNNVSENTTDNTKILEKTLPKASERESVQNITLSQRECVKNSDAHDNADENKEHVAEKSHLKEIPSQTESISNVDDDDQYRVAMDADDVGEVIGNVILNVQDKTTDTTKGELDDVMTVEENEINSIVQVVEFENGSNDKNMSQVESSTPQAKEKSSCEKIEIISVSTLKPYLNNDIKEDSNVSDCKVPTKRVDFISSPSKDMTIKNVYPKTPASAKTVNSFIEINSSREDGSFQAENNSCSEIKQEVEDNQLESKMTPIRAFKCARSLETVQSSTPINMETTKHEELLPEAEKHVIKDEDEPERPNEEMLEDNKDSSANINKEEIKWINPSVKVTTAEGSKIDVVVSTRINTSTNNCNDKIELQQVQIHNKKKSIVFSSEDEEEDDKAEEEHENVARELGEDDDDGESELAPGEKAYKRKHDFHDDEAMEVDDYESGDSMDSEERREIEENEIPIDGESIGSHTTEDEHDEYVEEEDSENADSFIVSDNEEGLECSESNDEDEQIDEDVNHDHNRKKKKTYKRLQRPADSSSSSSDEEDPGLVEQKEKLKHNCSNSDNDKKLECLKESSISQPEKENSTEIKPDFENMLDSSKLSDSALRLQCTAESESEEEANVVNDELMDVSRKEILRKLNQSDRFNKSVRDLNPEIDTSPVEKFEKKNTYEQLVEGHTTSTSADESANKIHSSRKIQSESHLGEVSVTSESDADKENVHESLKLPHWQKSETGLSVSFGNYKKPKNVSKGRQEWQRSFTIDVTVKDGDLKTAVTDVKLPEEPHTSPDSSSSSVGERENEELSDEDKRYLENIKHMPLPLGNPLIRTRRQSLALPTNPDMEICSSSHGASGVTGKKLKRKSLGVLSSSEFNPSQSFIDSIELHKSELNRQIGKRKRLSKSFCGALESHDNSIVDVDVRHLHKRSKFEAENSMVESHHDSTENINSSKLSTKDSSTPHQKKADKNDSNNNIQHILSRCDEILEAANRAKLEAKLNNKKNKGKLSKKLKKKSTLTTLSNEKNSDDALRKVSLEIKRKDKSKTVLSQAIKAANVILGKNKHTSQQNEMEKEVELESKRLPPDVLKAIEESASTKKKCKKEIRKDHGKIQNVCTTSTSAGNFVELPQTPEKKKKKTFIQLPTGKVSVEPVTPQKRSVLAMNGAEFRESPITPYAVGFKVRQIPIHESNSMSSAVSKNGKRKRHHEETLKERILPKSQWTQSGLFIEEEIPKNRRVAPLCSGSQKQQHINRNFKENALMRPDIKRGSKREMLLLKERRQVQGHY